MDVEDIEILSASIVLLYEDHLKSNGHIKTAVDLAKAMRLLREAVSPDVMEMCKEFKCRVPAKERS
jgi:hypothetical protein